MADRSTQELRHVWRTLHHTGPPLGLNRDLIIKGEDKKLSDAIKIGFIEGMIDFTESLTQLVQRGDVDRAAALEVAPNPEALRMGLKGIKVSQPGIL